MCDEMSVVFWFSSEC